MSIPPSTHSKCEGMVSEQSETTFNTDHSDSPASIARGPHGVSLLRRAQSLLTAWVRLSTFLVAKTFD